MLRIFFILFLMLWFMPTGLVLAQNSSSSPDITKIKVLDLRTAQTIALADNPNMTAAQARVEQARARVRQATASWWPSLNLSASGNRLHLPDSLYEPVDVLATRMGVSIDQTIDYYTTTAQATWVLFDGFYRSFKEKQANYDETSTTAAMTDSRRLLANAVADAFFNAQLAQTNIDIARADERFYQRQLQDAQNRYNVGSGPWGDVLNIKVQLNSAKTALINAQRAYEAAGYGLAGLMGLQNSTLPESLRLQPMDKHIDTTLEKEKPEALIQEAMITRPDIHRMEMLIKQAEAAHGMARAAFYPKIQAAGSVIGAKLNNPGLGSDNVGSSVGISMSWNLYAGGADKARLAESEQAKREAVYTLAGLRNAVAAEIRQDLALLAAAREQVRLQSDSVKLVQENRDLAKNEYNAGESSLVRLNEAQRDLTTTHGRLAQALVAYQVQRQHLLAATGRNLTGLKKTAPEK